MCNTNNPVLYVDCLKRCLSTSLRSLSSKQLTLFFLAAVPTIVLSGFINLSFISSAIAQDKPQAALPSVELTVAGKILNTELASTPNQRYMGLSFRKSLAENAGMLFVYPAEEQLVFTMRNTLIPLSIAFISEDLVIQEILHMPVGPNQIFPSKAPARFALEVNQGWFERNNIGVGEKISVGQ